MEDKEKDLEVREFILQDDFGIDIGDLSLISFVSKPATDHMYQLFSQNKYQFAKTDSEMKIVTGLAMKPNKKILRQDKSGEYFYCVFTDEQVRRASEIFLKNSNHTRTNIEHGELAGSNEIDGVYMSESWIVEDPEKDKATALGFKEVEKGDWYVSFKIENEQFWKFVKEYGGGFSIEGRFMDRLIEGFSEIELESRIKSIVFDEEMSDEEKEEKIKSLLFQ
jgi:hypothetical protein